MFLNCPFDDAYRPLFDALVFAVQDCGFDARCALEVEDSGEERIRKIKRIIRECMFGIHDISRVQLDAATGLPRFNMPLELGMFLGAQEFGSGDQKRKRSHSIRSNIVIRSSARTSRDRISVRTTKSHRA